MHKLLVLYPEPVDRAAFERHYRDVHLPLCARLPGLVDMAFALGVDEPDGGPYFAVFEATFASAEALGAALASPEGQAVQADVPNYATGGAVVVPFAAERPVTV
ncbi:EthD family reductase [Microbacterium immunditiarum]|uniref:Uncharacterized protein (TIGR02118 family) n=1 Tax=Microbacterium immunditiarum TaxID=337480 RepID=A0A7Y9GR23_9MICO|nr:EthD family reductase [Microbacterium immunditiarum]NYE21154.1 uncharacterized protein (TIGR02118 family) [Microbacterium immunditiarum]